MIAAVILVAIISVSKEETDQQRDRLSIIELKLQMRDKIDQYEGDIRVD